MLILLDIGNTAVTYGICKLKVPGTLSNFGSCSYSDIPKIVSKCYSSGDLKQYSNIVISSVVPHITRKIRRLVKGKPCRLWVAGANLPIPLKHRYPKNQKPGPDRLVTLYGAFKLYKAPLVVIDFGTAITFDYLSAKGIFEGGMIIPGPEIAFQTLLSRAALIPKNIRLPHKAKSFLGKNTYDCISSGVLQGYGAMFDELIHRFKSKYSNKLKFIATGGFAKHLKPYTKTMTVIDPQLSIKSLHLLVMGSDPKKAFRV